MKKVVLVLVVLLVGILVFGCSSTASPVPSKPATSAPPATTTAAAPPVSSEPIKIGGIFGLTGEAQMVGPSSKAAIEFRLEQIGGQIAGRKIQLIAEDDATDPTVGVEKARKLVQFDKVDVILGPVAGMTAPGVANFISKNNIPMMVFMAKPGAIIPAGSNNIFLPFGTDHGVGYQAGLYAANKLGYKTAVLMYEDFVSGVAYADAATTAFQKQGGTVTQRIAVKFGTMDFSPYLSTLKEADVVMFWFNPPVVARFINQYYAAGLKMPLYILGSSQIVTKVMPNFGEKIVGMRGIGMYSSMLDTQINKDYVAAFTKKYDPNLIMEMGASADANLLLYLEAVKATNGDTTPAKVIDALHKVKVTTPAGTFSFNEKNIGIGSMYIFQIVKVGDNQYNWKPIDTINQAVLDMPAQ